MVTRFLVLVVVSCVSSSVPVANAAGVVEPVSLSAALSAASAMPSSANSTTSTTVPVKPVKKTVPVKPKNKNGSRAVGTTVPVIAAGEAGTSGSNIVGVLLVDVPGLISVCVNKSTSVLRDTADNSCSSGSEVKVEWLDSGASPKICVNNNNRQMTLAQDGKCSTKNSAVADVTVNKQILACADDKTGVLRYQKSGICATNDDPVVWVLKDQGVARNVDSGVKKGVIEIISLIPTTGTGTGAGANTGGSTKTVTTSPATNTSSPTTTTTTAVATATATTTTTTSSSTTTTTIALRVSGSFAGYLGGNCPDGSGIPWYWGSGGQARAGGCSAAASIAPTTTAPATTTAAVSATTIAPVVVPGAPATPTGVAGHTQVTVTVAAGTGGTPTSYTITHSTASGGTYATGCTVTGASGSCVVTGLTNGTTYFFKTTATNSAGTSSLSTASSAVTPVVTVSGAPTVGTATVASPTSATVACTSPLSNGGTTITAYTATAVGTAITGTLTSATCTTITVAGLTTGTAYTFTVTATNTTGTSAASGASNSVTPVATVSGAPTIGTATIASATSVTVACTTPGSNGGATITTYTFISSPGGVTATLTSATCSATTVTGLTTNTAYTFTVKSTNSAGASSASAASTSVTPGATCATYGICIVGNTGPGGGTVFYVQASGGTFTSTGSPCGTTCKYLEVDATWSVLQWCPAGSGVLSNALSTTPFGSAIGSGYSNTQTMLAGCSSGLAYSVTATYGGKSDWYMPSRGEWDAMYAARASLPIVFANRGQMASEEASAGWAHEMNGNNGLWTTYTKAGLNAGIGSFPIRAF